MLRTIGTISDPVKTGRMEELGFQIAQEKAKQGTYLAAAAKKAKLARKPSAAQGRNPAEPRVTIAAAPTTHSPQDALNDEPYVPPATAMSKKTDFI